MTNETYHKKGELVHGYRVGSHPLYGIWSGIKSRCNNKNEVGYKDYGGRGIGYCKRWQHFKNFAEDMWPKPDGTSLERKNNDKGYSPSNCIWATREQQMRNRRIFKNSSTGHTGIIPDRRGFNARYDVGKIRYDLGNFDTIQEAIAVRKKFIRLYESNNPRYKAMLSGGHDNQRLRGNNSTGIRGITKHPQGFMARKTVKGKRIYLGFSVTFAGAKKLMAGAT